MSADLVKDLMRQIGPLLDLDSVDETNDAPHWILTVDDICYVDAVLDADRGMLCLIASIKTPDQVDSEILCPVILTHNHGWPTSGKARAGLRGDTVSMTDEIAVTGLELSELSRSVTNITAALRGFMSTLPQSQGSNDMAMSDSFIRV